MRSHKINHLINHVVLVLDASDSMSPWDRILVEAADKLIKQLAEGSTNTGQETRITVYLFNTDVWCVIYDMDVLRLPSLAQHYRTSGMTALIDASMQAIIELSETPERYGDHAFLVYVMTDGGENASRKHGRYDLAHKLKSLPGHWTVAALVPNSNGKFAAKNCGFEQGNIEVWDATSAQGVREMTDSISTTTTSWMAARATGVRGTKNLFDIGANVVNAQTVLDAGLQPLDYSEYDLVPIGVWPGQVKPADYDEKKRRKPWKAHGGRIDEFIQNVRGGQYIVGQGYYQLVADKVEKIQPSKNIAVVNKKTDRVYTGAGARKLLGLPDNMEVRVKPSASDDYLVYVQSKSPNRLLVPGCRLLIFKKV